MCNFFLCEFGSSLRWFCWFLSGAGRFVANLHGDRLQSNLDFIARDFLSFCDFVMLSGCVSDALMLICNPGNAHSPKVIYALPLEIFAFSSESTIGYVSLFSRYQSVALQCFLSVLMLHVLDLSHAVSFGLQAFPPFFWAFLVSSLFFF